MEHLNYRTIKSRAEYIPIKIQDAGTRHRFKTWKSSKDYMIKYMRLEDINSYLDDKLNFIFVKNNNHD